MVIGQVLLWKETERDRERGREGREGRKEGTEEKQNHPKPFVWIEVIYSFTK